MSQRGLGAKDFEGTPRIIHMKGIFSTWMRDRYIKGKDFQLLEAAIPKNSVAWKVILKNRAGTDLVMDSWCVQKATLSTGQVREVTPT